jgi:hypothetical protein
MLKRGEKSSMIVQTPEFKEFQDREDDTRNQQCINESDLQRDVIHQILNLKDHVVSKLENFI